MKIRNEQMKKVNRERQTLIYIFVIKLQFNTLYIKKKKMYCVNNTPFANLKHIKSLKYLAELDREKESRKKTVSRQKAVKQPMLLHRSNQEQRQDKDKDIDRNNNDEIEDRCDVLIEKFMIFVFDDE